MQGRGNGLRAASYSPLAVLDPQLADLMLELLAEQGIAAYAVPFGGETGPSLDVQPPDRPKDRLWVDATSLDSASQVLADCVGTPAAESAEAAAETARDSAGGRAGSTPLPGLDEDAAWQQIVANFSSESADPVPRWPVTEEADPAEKAGAESTETAEEQPRPGRLLRRVEHPIGLEELGEDEIQEADEDEHYVPPPPPPLPTGDPVSRASWLGVLGGPLVMLVATVAGWDLGPIGYTLCGGGFVVGFITLVARMKDDPGRGEDDGAVV